MQRNTFIFTAILAVVAALVVGVNIGKSMRSIPAPLVPTIVSPTATPPTLISYTNEKCGVTFMHPSSLQRLESTSSGTILTDPKNQEDSIIIVCQKDIPRVPLAPENMEQLTLFSASGSASLSATLYHDGSGKDGTPIDKLIFYNPSKKLDVFIAGFGNVYDQVIKTVKLLP